MEKYHNYLILAQINILCYQIIVWCVVQQILFPSESKSICQVINECHMIISWYATYAIIVKAGQSSDLLRHFATIEWCGSLNFSELFDSQFS
jgi:hypothetical protein